MAFFSTNCYRVECLKTKKEKPKFYYDVHCIFDGFELNRIEQKNVSTRSELVIDRKKKFRVKCSENKRRLQVG